MASDAQRGPDEVALEIDAPGMHPDTAPTALLLEAAAAYFSALSKAAELEGLRVSFVGLELRDKCVEIVARSDAPALAQRLASSVVSYATGAASVPRGLGDQIERFQDSVRAFGPAFTARVRIGAWSAVVVPPEVLAAGHPAELTTLRVRVEKAGGRAPRVALTSQSEPARFSLKVTKSQARLLAQNLYEEVDIEASVFRSDDGRIRSGTVHEVYPLDREGDPVETWRDWFAKATGGHWDGIDDVEGELRRDD